MRSGIIQVLLFIITFAAIVVAEQEASTFSFAISNKGGSSSNKLKASVSLDNVKCEFRFSFFPCAEMQQRKQLEQQAAAAAAAAAAKQPQQPDDPAKYLTRIRGECFTKLEGYWNYKVCVADKVTQFHEPGENYDLGFFNENDSKQVVATKQVFTDGTECDVQGQKKRRKTTVVFMCGPSSALITIREVETCVYEFTVTHPQLCGDNTPFERYNGNAIVQSGASASTTIVNSEDDYWYMEIEKVVANSEESAEQQVYNYICTAKTILRDVKAEPTHCFAKYTMQIYADGKGKDKVKSVVARHSRRRYMNNNEIAIKHDALSITSTQEFDGSLEYVRVTV